MSMRCFGLLAAPALGAMVLVCGACGDDEGGERDGGGTCLPALDTACEPPWDPTFDELFSRVITRSCSSPATGAQCHAEAGGASGLFLFDADEAYDALVNGHGHGEPVVVPFDPACSELIQRLESTVSGFAMPIGEQLPPGERCAFVKWVEAGAVRGE